MQEASIPIATLNEYDWFESQKVAESGVVYALKLFLENPRRRSLLVFVDSWLLAPRVNVLLRTWLLVSDEICSNWLLLGE